MHNYVNDVLAGALADGLVNGRNLKEGYQRGVGLTDNGFVARLQNDPDYLECLKWVGRRTIVIPARLMNLFLLIKFFMPQIIPGAGAIIEFGSYRGGSAMFMALLVKRLNLPIKVYGLDTFEGMPETSAEHDLHKAGDFSDAFLDEVNAYKNSLYLDNLEFIKGLFQDTAGDVLQCSPRVCLAHIDCDTYDSVAYAYEAVKPRMTHGGYYVFDDATHPTCLGATAAVEDLLIRRDNLNCEQIYPHFVFRAYHEERERERERVQVTCPY